MWVLKHIRPVPYRCDDGLQLLLSNRWQYFTQGEWVDYVRFNPYDNSTFQSFKDFKRFCWLQGFPVRILPIDIHLDLETISWNNMIKNGVNFYRILIKKYGMKPIKFVNIITGK